MEDMLNGVFYF